MSKNKEESLHELMAGMKPRGKEPRNAGVLDSWIDHAEADFGIAASGRVRWLIASTVITAMLQQVVDDDNACRFSLKGGTLLQHVFGLASRATKDIDGPYLSYDQGIHNSFYYSEEILSQIPHKKSIVVSDRATLFNLLIGLDGYTIATGILNSNLNGDNIVSIPLDIDDEIDIVYLKHEKATLSKMGEKFLDNLVKEVTFDN